MRILLTTLLFVALFNCSSDDDAKREGCNTEVWGLNSNCDSTGCEYYVDYGTSSETSQRATVSQSVFDYYTERLDNQEIVCWEGANPL